MSEENVIKMCSDNLNKLLNGGYKPGSLYMYLSDKKGARFDILADIVYYTDSFNSDIKRKNSDKKPIIIYMISTFEEFIIVYDTIIKNFKDYEEVNNNKFSGKYIDLLLVDASSHKDVNIDYIVTKIDQCIVDNPINELLMFILDDSDNNTTNSNIFSHHLKELAEEYLVPVVTSIEVIDEKESFKRLIDSDNQEIFSFNIPENERSYDYFRNNIIYLAKGWQSLYNADWAAFLRNEEDEDGDDRISVSLIKDRKKSIEKADVVYLYFGDDGLLNHKDKDHISSISFVDMILLNTGINVEEFYAKMGGRKKVSDFINQVYPKTFYGVENAIICTCNDEAISMHRELVRPYIAINNTINNSTHMLYGEISGFPNFFNFRGVYDKKDNILYMYTTMKYVYDTFLSDDTIIAYVENDATEGKLIQYFPVRKKYIKEHNSSIVLVSLGNANTIDFIRNNPYEMGFCSV